MQRVNGRFRCYGNPKLHTDNDKSHTCKTHTHRHTSREGGGMEIERERANPCRYFKIISKRVQYLLNV